MDTTGLLILLAALVVAAGFGLYRYLTDGRLKAARAPAAQESGLSLPGLDPQAGPAVVQFSSEVCAPCRATRTKLTQLSAKRPFTYLDLDVAEHLDLARELHITRTPTLLMLDAGHTVRFTISGAPTQQALTEALDVIAPTPT